MTGPHTTNIWTQSANDIYVDAVGTRVGIGTNVPAHSLDVVGDVHVTGTFISGATTTYGDGAIDLSSGTNLNIDNGTLYLDNSGNRVGIGTTAPQGAFDVTTSGFSALDQSHDDSTGSVSGTDNYQSFTAGLTGKLTQVDLKLHSGIVGQPQTATVEIYSGHGVGGQLLTSQSTVFQYIFNIFQEVHFTWPTDVIAGQQYTIRFYVPPSQVLDGIRVDQDRRYLPGSNNLVVSPTGSDIPWW